MQLAARLQRIGDGPRPDTPPNPPPELYSRMRLRYLSALVIVATFAAGCASTSPTGRATSSAPVSLDTAALRQLAADTAARADSLASRVMAACSDARTARTQCVEQSLYFVLERSGIARSMAVLDVLAERDDDLRREAHGLAHGLGIAAYESPETVAATFAACPNTQISGCYHGVIQGYFLAQVKASGELTAQQLDALCTPHRPRLPLYGQCAHGMGHGLIALYRRDLPQALAACDRVSDGYARESCWGGAFMENIIGATHPGLTAEAHAHAAGGDAAPAAEHHGAGHEGMHHDPPDSATAARPPWKPIDRNDPLYPCNAVAEKYGYQCYMIQTAAILANNHGDIPQTARDCALAPARLVPVCHASLGRDLTSYAARDPARTAELCSRAGPAAEPDCLRGAATALIDVAQDPRDGLGLCRATSAAALKEACYGAVIRWIATRVAGISTREAVCALAEPEYVDRCKLGRADAAVGRQ
jgi:hypothetical protein